MTSFNLPEDVLFLIGSILWAVVCSASMIFCVKKRAERGGVAAPVSVNCATSQCSASSVPMTGGTGNRFIRPEPSEAWHPELADGNLVSAISDDPAAPQSKSIAIASQEDSVVKGCGREVPKENFKAGYKALKANDKKHSGPTDSAKKA